MTSETHQILLRYFNTSCFSKGDYFLHLISPNISIQKNASFVVNKYAQEKSIKNQGANQDVNVEVYKGDNPAVLKMMKLFQLELKDDLFGAYLHGSLATNDVILYSDYDALLILKDKVFTSKKQLVRVATKLSSAQKIMHEYDPLQHHGWFIITESMLKNYPLTYFPPVLFEQSTSMFPNQGLKFEINYDANSADFETPFKNLSESLIAKLVGGFRPNNVFNLKSLLSEFMLLPTLYLQAKLKKGVLKEKSFDLVKNDFDKNDWEIMDRVSVIRKNWFYEISSFQKGLLSNSNSTIRKYSRRFAPDIPKDIMIDLTPEFYNSMAGLARLMKEKINSKN